MIEALLLPLDRVRGFALRATRPISSVLVADRALRVTLLGAVVVVAAFALAVGAPLWALALGPIVFGVPHLLSDLRYLVIRQRLHQRPAFWWASVALIAVTFGAGLPAGLCAALVLVLDARSTRLRRCGVMFMILGLMALSARWSERAHLTFVHLHNLVAVLLWFVWRTKRSAADRLLLVSIGLLSGLILAGWVEPLSWAKPASWAPDLQVHLRSLAPASWGRMGPRAVLLFAFLQAVHYGVWLRLIPEDDRPQRTTRSFARSYRALLREFGAIPLLLLAVFALAIALWAVFDLSQARAGYLRLAGFHGYLELAVLARWWTQRGAA